MLRKLGFLLAVGSVFVVAARFGREEIFFFLYLALVSVGLAYLLARRGLSNLEAGSWLDRPTPRTRTGRRDLRCERPSDRRGIGRDLSAALEPPRYAMSGAPG
jgi:hypothetical protein